MVTCSNCTNQKIRSLGRCATCYNYFNKNKKERPQKLIHRVLGHTETHLPLWCKNCGNPELRCNNRCDACYQYWKRNKKERPKRLWNKIDNLCRNCSRPLYKCASIGIRCKNCFYFLKRRGIERPQRLWKMGVGWCDCGESGVIKIFGVLLCINCLHEYDQLGQMHNENLLTDSRAKRK